jgi:hypothetical protein
MELFFTSPTQADAGLRAIYAKAFGEARELYLVSAYLTAWSNIPNLNRACKSLTIIIGKDFGITRKEACREVLRWLPDKFLSNFLVADGIAGFHPKALFWRDGRGRHHMLVGSSNMTEAAMAGNVEANMYRVVTPEEFDKARAWVAGLTTSSVPVAGGWLAKYKEAPRGAPGGGSKQNRKAREAENASVMPLALPDPAAGNEKIQGRRRQERGFQPNKGRLLTVFRQRVANRISNKGVYDNLTELWAPFRFQFGPWAITAAGSDWKAFSQAFLAVYNAPEEERDGVVQAQMDWLAEKRVSTRKAVFTEFLCRYFPDAYPLVNNPVKEWAKGVGYRGPWGASEGAKYLIFAKTLRAALAQKPRGYPARNMAELDLYIWAWIEQERARQEARRRRRG